MLSAGLTHGELSEFNVLVGTEGPVIIDLPQAVNSAGNNGAFAMLERDVNNLRGTLGRFALELLHRVQDCLGQSGNFSARSTASKRGSLRSGSRSGSTLSLGSPGSCVRSALSSHLTALGRSAHWA